MVGIGTSRGVAFGIINTAAVAAAIAVWSRGQHLGLAIMMLWFMALPAGAIGWLLGAVAQRLRAPVVVRIGFLVMPPVMFVQTCAQAFRLVHLMPALVAPTIVCALLLERTTRPDQPLTRAVAEVARRPAA